MSSAVAMQKEIAKTVLRAAGVPVPGGLVANRLDVAKAHMLPPPYVIKPLSEGSSIGVYIVRADQAHPPQELMRPDWKYGERVMVEPFIPGKELTCAVIADKPTDVIEIIAHTAFYDYEAKYAPGGSTHILPAPVPADVYAECQRLALIAHNALGCRGVTRADFRWDDTKGVAGIACLEVNTQPGMTGTSLVPELAAYAGMPFPELARWMIEDASLGR
jgi:D-alanine-D-alanine ligase